MEDFRVYGYYGKEYLELRRKMRAKHYTNDMLYYLITKNKLECKTRDRIIIAYPKVGTLYGIEVYIEI